MSLNPWSEIRKLKADLAEALAANTSYVKANHRAADTNRQLTEQSQKLVDENWSLRIENKRLTALLERAVFRDPDTGRLLPKGMN